MSSKYSVLLNVLDKIRYEAPLTMPSYRPIETDIDKINQARSKSIIHLYIKSNFWLTDFKSREHFVTDGAYDGWIDGYYIDEINKMVFIIQAKFRTNERNFESKDITYDELLKMDTSRIIQDAEAMDEDWNSYRGKILQLQRQISEISDIARYKYKVVILANLSNEIKPSQLKRLTGGYEVEIYDFERMYNDLLFPIIHGTYFNENELNIEIDLSSTSDSSNIEYYVDTANWEVEIQALFVPTKEIGKILYKYKNSILKYNPRSYLEMKSWHVNNEIYESIVSKTTNEFALFNNGITILSTGTSFQKNSWRKKVAQLLIESPQIINWWQTSYTLSWIYEEMLEWNLPENIFDGKGVLLKIITLNEENTNVLEIIESISQATNNQSKVTDADRRSNDKIQIKVQKKVFDKFWLFYERKKWEFADGVRHKYINRDLIINRTDFVRLAFALEFPNNYDNTGWFNYKNPKNVTEAWLFKTGHFDYILSDVNQVDRIMYGYFLMLELKKIKKMQSLDVKDKFWLSLYWNALRYWELWVIIVTTHLFYKEDFITDELREVLNLVLSKWKKFEEDSISYISNKNYFNKDLDISDYAWYYKSENFIRDIKQNFCSQSQF